MAEALAAVIRPSFSLAIQGVGVFASTEGASVLWADVVRSEELMDLHQAIASSLAGLGFRPEERPYRPHVTIARCGGEVPSSVVDRFLVEHQRAESAQYRGLPVRSVFERQ